MRLRPPDWALNSPSVDDDGNPIPRYSRITGWDVATTYLGGHDLDVFVGYGSPDFSKSDWMNDSDLYGFGFEGVTFGYASMDSTTPGGVTRLCRWCIGQLLCRNADRGARRFRRWR
jgi:hypothetical protein